MSDDSPDIISNDDNNSLTSNKNQHVEGINTIAGEETSHSEGYTTRAMGFASHAEGAASAAIGDGSHAEGITTLTQGTGSHAEGDHTIAQGRTSHAEGSYTKASGLSSHSEGSSTVAEGNFSHTEGKNTTALGFEGAHVMGRFGTATASYSWHLANGTSEAEQGLAAQIRGDGYASLDMGWRLGNTGYAEAFETLDGKPIEPGYFVTLDSDKVRKANEKDYYILGITCASPAVLGNSSELRWKNKYLTNRWGKIRYHEVKVQAMYDSNGNLINAEHTEIMPVLNPDWKNNESYVPRAKRDEWVSVVVLGQVLVRDDGSCHVNGYCLPNSQGIAVPCRQSHYRVMKRISRDQILVMVH